MDYQEKILISLIEVWNDNNPTERLNPDLIRIIDEHLKYAYTTGTEQMNKMIIKRLELIADVHGVIQSYVILPYPLIYWIVLIHRVGIRIRDI